MIQLFRKRRSLRRSLRFSAVVTLAAWLFFSGLIHAQTLPDRSCVILSRHSGKALQVHHASVESLSNVELYHFYGGAHQCWRFAPERFQEDTRSFAVFSLRSGKVLDVMGYSRENGANVQQFSYYGTHNQHWRFIPVDETGYSIISRNSGKCLSAVDAENGANVRQFTCTGENHQIWDVRAYPYADTACQIISKGSGKALDVFSRELDKGTNVQQFEPNDKPNQRWTLAPSGMEDGVPTYVLVSLHSGLVLDVVGKRKDDGANVQQYTYSGRDNQRWKLIPVPTAADGVEDLAAPPTHPAETEIVPDRYYRFAAVHSGKCLDVEGDSDEDRANVQQYECHDGDNQLWQLIEHRIVPNLSGK